MKRKFSVIFLIVLLIMIAGLYSYAAIDVPEYIKVGLFYGNSAVNSFTLSSDAGMEIGTRNGDKFKVIKEIEANKTIAIKKGSNEYSIYIEGIGEIGDSENIVRIIPFENKSGINIISVNGKRYRGDIEVRRFTDSDMTVINVLKMQEYLYGVVPREIGGNSPIEAVKAQAIIARTYATKNYNKRSKWGYNLNSDVSDQAYGGYEWENKNSNKAVDETDGMIVTYNGELIGGYYFSTSGGYTESSVNVWGGDLAYLKAVPDTYEPTNLTMSEWKVTLSAEQIKDRLESYGVDVGDVLNIIPTEHSDVGRVTKLKIVGTKGTEIITKEKTRTYLGLNSQWYTVNDEPPKVSTVIKENSNQNNNDNSNSDTDNTVKNKPLLQKLISFLTKDKEDVEQIEYSAKTSNATTFHIQGRGWGHAVGMSQNGAIGMANNNFTYKEIIKWYYTGAKVEK